MPRKQDRIALRNPRRRISKAAKDARWTSNDVIFRAVDQVHSPNLPSGLGDEDAGFIVDICDYGVDLAVEFDDVAGGFADASFFRGFAVGFRQLRAGDEVSNVLTC